MTTPQQPAPAVKCPVVVKASRAVHCWVFDVDNMLVCEAKNRAQADAIRDSLNERDALLADRARLDLLESMGVDQIYLHGGGQFNPTSQKLRVALDQQLAARSSDAGAKEGA